jgi:hypothetical protein
MVPVFEQHLDIDAISRNMQRKSSDTLWAGLNAETSLSMRTSKRPSSYGLLDNPSSSKRNCSGPDRSTQQQAFGKHQHLHGPWGLW